MRLGGALTPAEVTAALGLLDLVEEAQAVARRCYWQLKPLALDVKTGRPLHEVHEWLLWRDEERTGRKQ